MRRGEKYLFLSQQFDCILAYLKQNYFEENWTYSKIKLGLINNFRPKPENLGLQKTKESLQNYFPMLKLVLGLVDKIPKFLAQIQVKSHLKFQKCFTSKWGGTFLKSVLQF